MTRVIPIAIAAAAALGACSTPPQTGGPTQPRANFVTNVQPYHAGNGVVQNVFPTPGSAAAGGSAPSQRLEIKMDSGTVQYVDVTSNEFTKGTRISLSEDKTIRRQ